MIWNIIVDSSCDLKDFSYKDENNEVRYYSVPFIITSGGRDFVDDANIDIDDMLYTMEHSATASFTSCPSPASWMEYYELEGNCIAITISKNLSGSYNSACAAVEMMKETHPDKNVAVVNSYATGPSLILTVHEIVRCIKAGMSFDEVVRVSQEVAYDRPTSFALSSFINLVKNGRMSPVLGFVAQKLGFWGIGVRSPEGTIDVQGKVRGGRRAVHALVEDVRKRGAECKTVYICHCCAEEIAFQLKDEILKNWPDKNVEIYPTRGLCSFYAERNGLIVSCY